MKRAEGNGFKGHAVIEPVVEEDLGQTSRPVAAQEESAKQPYVPEKGKQRASLKDNARVLVIGGGIALVLLLLAIGGIPRKNPAPAKRSGASKQGQAAKTLDNGTTAPSSIVPLLDSGRRPDEGTDKSMVRPEEIARTANKRPKPSPGTNLGSIRPFENPQLWQPAPFQPVTSPASALAHGQAIPSETTETKNERDALDKASLVFVRNNTAPAVAPRPPESRPRIDLGIGLAPGTRLRAKLESAVSTAVQAPVVAVIEYNYEQNGEIVVPAGAKAFGRLEAADRCGYIAVRFDSLMLPDGSSISMEAAATGLELRPLKGRVEGKHTGKNILVRAFAGVGEIAATLAGRSRLNQPLSETDLLREKVSNNIAQSSDQEVAKLAITEHLVVSVPADTEIYVVLQKPTKPRVQNARVQLPTPTQTTNQLGIEELRQLLHLQQELNQATPPKPTPE
ncbi:MAG TPA: TrbI/VirB10 family protein [Candidatus Angelobacter sp.]